MFRQREPALLAWDSLSYADQIPHRLFICGHEDEECDDWCEYCLEIAGWQNVATRIDETFEAEMRAFEKFGIVAV